MADVHNFIIPEQQYGGLYKLSDNLERDKQRKEAAAIQRGAKKASLSSFLIEYTNPKDHLSGSPTDPAITSGYNDILEKGVKLMNENEGLTQDMLLTALSGDASRLAEYAAKAKAIKANTDKRISEIGENSGYDKFKLAELARRKAFFNEDGSPKDISEIDPTKDYITETVLTNPQDVTNNKGIDEWMKGQQKLTDSNDIISENAKGGRERKKVKVTAYNWAVPDVDESGVHNRKFVPEYGYAGDNGVPITLDGKKVRIVSDNLYTNVLANSSGTADWLRGQVLSHIKSGEYKDSNGDAITIDSPQAKQLAKHLLYEELKGRGIGSMEDVIAQKDTPIKNVTNVINNMGNNNNQTPTVDMWGDIYNKVTGDNRVQRGAGYAASALSGIEQSIILDLLREATGKKGGGADNPPLSQSDFYLKADADGNLYAIDNKTNKSIMTITPFDINTRANRDLNKTWGSPAEQKAGSRININTGGNIPTSRTQKPTKGKLY